MTRFRRLLIYLATILAAWPGGRPLAQDVGYMVDIVGVEGDLAEQVREASILVRLRDRPPGSMVALRRRAQADEERVMDVLRSNGFYAGEVEITLAETARPVPVTIAVSLGKPFVLGAFRVSSARPDPDATPLVVGLESLGLELGRRAIAREVVEAERRLLLELARRGYPLARIVDRKAVADFATHRLAVDVSVDTGPFARFGRVEVAGLEDVAEAYVQRRLPWEQGDSFDSRDMEQARQELVATGLFSSVRLSTGEAVEAGGLLPIRIELRERPHRSIGGGVRYSTSQGPGVALFWEHRNLYGENEFFRVSAEYDSTVSAFNTTFRNPDFGGKDQDLVLSSRLREESTEAFDSTALSASAVMQWRLTETWRASAGLAAERSRQEEAGMRRNFTLVSVPGQLYHDSTDDLLDPTRGGRLQLDVEPVLEALGSSLNFVRTELADSVYFQAFEEPRVILAGWARLGAIFGAQRQELPADRRFYAGGGGSVRGYGFQLAGPVNAEGDPIGGKSLLAFGGEVRYRPTETIGIVGFLEGGNVYRDQLPSLAEDLFWGAGLGFRYFTPIGPVRGDIAIPLRRRDDVDDPFQIYLSFGQAF